MSRYNTKNFDPAVYYGADGAITEDNDWPADADWNKWLAGKEPRLPKHLANSLWFNFTAALDYFIFYNQGLSFSRLIDDPVFLTKYITDLRVALDDRFSNVMQIICDVDNEKINNRSNWFTCSPYALESKLNNFKEFEYTPEKYINLMSAYSIMQCDESITGLLESDAIKSATCSLYADQGIACIIETMMFMNKDEELKRVHSQFSKRNAFKRHIETYELKQQAIDHWRAHIDPKLSNDKAAELLTKVVALSHRKLSQYVAEAKRENIHPAS